MAKIPFDIKFRPQIESGVYRVETKGGVPVHILSFEALGPFPICYQVGDGMNADFPPRPDVYFANNKGECSYTPNSFFIVTPEEELTPFEEKLIQFSDERNSMECDNLPEDRECEILADHLHRNAAELLSLAREQFVKDGYVIEKKIFHDAMEKVDPEVKKEVSENMDMQIALRTEYEKGRADALKDLPRWKKTNEPATHIPILPYIAAGGRLHRCCTGYSISISDLERLPKED